jgi:tight adherence protein B
VSGLTYIIGRVTLTLLVLALAAGALGLFGTAMAPGRRAVRRYLRRLDHTLRFLRSHWRGEHVLALLCGSNAAVVGAALAFQQWALMAVVPLVALAPTALLDRRVAERIGRIEQQIEPWLVAIANSLKASPSLGEAIRSSTTLIEAPLAEEVELLVREVELGMPLDRAIDQMAARIYSSTLTGAALALRIARQSGGNLPALLENAAAALRELGRLEGVVRTKTAEGKAQALVIGLIPVPMIGGIHWMDPHFFAPLASTFTGNLVVAAAAVLWALAILLARKILAVDV